MEQLTQAISKYQSENENLSAELAKTNEMNNAFKHALQDRDRQLENWKSTYAKRNGGESAFDPETNDAPRFDDDRRSVPDFPSSSSRTNPLARSTSHVWRKPSHGSSQPIGSTSTPQHSKRHRSSDPGTSTNENGFHPPDFRAGTPTRQRIGSANREHLLGSFERFAGSYRRNPKDFESPHPSGRRNLPEASESCARGAARPPSRGSRGSRGSISKSDMHDLFNRPPSRRGSPAPPPTAFFTSDPRSLSTDGIRQPSRDKMFS